MHKQQMVLQAFELFQTTHMARAFPTWTPEEIGAAGDLVIENLLKRPAPTYDESKSSLKTYLTRAVRNTLITGYNVRKGRLRGFTEVPFVDLYGSEELDKGIIPLRVENAATVPSAEDTAEIRESQDGLWALAEAVLTAPQFAALRLRYSDDWTPARKISEVAAALAIELGAVKSRLKKGTRRLRNDPGFAQSCRGFFSQQKAV